MKTLLSVVCLLLASFAAYANADLAAQLRQESQLFESVFHRRDLTRLKDKALYYLPPAELARLHEQVRAAAAATTAAAQPETALAQLNEQLARVAAATPQQRQTREQQYARLAGPLLAAFQPSAAASSRHADARTPELVQALAQFEQSLKLDSKHAKTLLNVGIVRAFGKQDLDGASKAWQQVIALAPNSPEGQAAKRALDSLQSAHPALGGAQKPAGS